ncbi:hypothetical protein BGZ98_007936 [Dissophora globulifera]|nr:hypothetical protein BGZ98_007936 [Dissophora globulifera]
MLHISPIARQDRFLNEELPFVNTAGTMNFNLTSPELLDLDSYQQMLKRLILVLASQSTSSSSSVTPTGAEASTTPSTTTEVLLGSGGAFILDTSVIEPGFETATIGGIRAVAGADGAAPLSSSQNYPFSFIATSQHPVHASGPAPMLFFIRLPLNPFTHGIQCQLSARRLCAKHVVLLDKILRRLCDASPGAFMVGYSDGPSGVDAGTEVVYSGENSTHQPQPSKPSHQQQHQTQTAATSINLEQSIAMARDRGDMELDSRVAGLVGHVEHPSMATTGVADKDQKQPNSPLPQGLALKAQGVKASKTEIGTVSPSTDDGRVIAHKGDEKDSILLQDRLKSDLEGAGDGILNYDFGLLDDMEQLIDVHSMVDIDQLHDMLWVN